MSWLWTLSQVAAKVSSFILVSGGMVSDDRAVLSVVTVVFCDDERRCKRVRGASTDVMQEEEERNGRRRCVSTFVYDWRVKSNESIHESRANSGLLLE